MEDVPNSCIRSEVFRVGEFNSVSQICVRPTRVAIVTKIFASYLGARRRRGVTMFPSVYRVGQNKRCHSAYSRISRKLTNIFTRLFCIRQGQCTLNMSINTRFNNAILYSGATGFRSLDAAHVSIKVSKPLCLSFNIALSSGKRLTRWCYSM